jgi:hypothetical protein
MNTYRDTYAMYVLYHASCPHACRYVLATFQFARLGQLHPPTPSIIPPTGPTRFRTPRLISPTRTSISNQHCGVRFFAIEFRNNLMHARAMYILPGLLEETLYLSTTWFANQWLAIPRAHWHTHKQRYTALKFRAATVQHATVGQSQATPSRSD